MQSSKFCTGHKKRVIFDSSGISRVRKIIMMRELELKTQYFGKSFKKTDKTIWSNLKVIHLKSNFVLHIIEDTNRKIM